ncbi:hypothetical protein [Roseibium sp. M-1]
MGTVTVPDANFMHSRDLRAGSSFFHRTGARGPSPEPFAQSLLTMEVIAHLPTDEVARHRH